MRRAVPILCVPLLALLTGRAPAQTVSLELQTKGAVVATVEVSNPVDAAHFCSAAADPWGADRQVDTRPAPFPFYRVVYGQSGPDAELQQPGPSLGITLSHWVPPAADDGTGDHEDPLHDSFELVIEGRHFVGHAGLPDPAPRLQFAWRDDGRGGAFLVTGLQELGGDGRLDAEGTWACPAIDQALPEVAVAPRPLFAGAVVASADPPLLPFALQRVGDRWRATGEDGAGFTAEADLSPLRLSPMLRAWADAGQTVLLVQGEMYDGDPPRLIARRLDGVTPAPP